MMLMSRYGKWLAGVTMLIVFPVGVARAQCQFAHPKAAKTIQGDLVQDFVPCGEWNHCGDQYNAPNTTSDNLIAACEPPQTWSQRNGDPPDGWRFGSSGSGSYRFKVLSRPPVREFGPVPGDAVDFALTLNLSGIEDTSGPANGQGLLSVVVRVTFDSRTGDDKTVATLPVSVHFTLENGKARLKATFDAPWGPQIWGQPPLPPCTSVAIVSVQVLDGNANSFAVPGLHLD